MRSKIVVGNWKMNKTLEEGIQLAKEIQETELPSGVQVVVAPPFIHLAVLSRLFHEKGTIQLAAQNCHHESAGAYTGEISASMVSSTGARYVIIGHSERRQYQAESSGLLMKKVVLALENGLTPIFCLGENLDQRNANQHLETVKQQLKESVFQLSPNDFAKVILAYEPIWAIGTGQTATSHQAQGMHNFIRSEINKKYGKEVSESALILYGGSCNAQNAKELFSCLDVDGGLIGGASLKSADFTAIIRSF